MRTKQFLYFVTCGYLCSVSLLTLPWVVVAFPVYSSFSNYMHTTDSKLKPRLNEYRCKQWLLEKYVLCIYMNNALKIIKNTF